MLKKNLKKKIAEYRSLPNDEKGLSEKRNELIVEMEGIVEKSKAEQRAFNEDEINKFKSLKGDIGKIDETIKAIEEARALTDFVEDKKQGPKTEERALEEKFINFIKGDERALDIAGNGGIVPTHIANKIIEKVKELSPIYAKATIYNVGGDLVFPIYDEETSSIGATFMDDLQELTEGTGKFKTIKLGNFIVGTLAKVSKSLVNRTDFDLVSFVITKVATAIAEFLEKHLIQGAIGKNEGLLATTNLVEMTGNISVDNLIDVQMTVPEVYQANAAWIMHKDTLKNLRKLKDQQGNYILGTALSGFGFTLLGKPVYFTESMDKAEVGKKPIIYGDLSGLYVKLAQNVEIQVLIEKYATQHAIGVVGYVEFDSKIVEKQKISALSITA